MGHTNRLYPATKWSFASTSNEQLAHIISEAVEVDTAWLKHVVGGQNQARIDEEVADLEHSIQTYWDCRAREGLDVGSVRTKIVEKNNSLERRYYHSCHGDCGQLATYAVDVAGERRHFCPECLELFHKSKLLGVG